MFHMSARAHLSRAIPRIRYPRVRTHLFLSNLTEQAFSLG
jgi:hypothetical protein